MAHSQEKPLKHQQGHKGIASRWVFFHVLKDIFLRTKGNEVTQDTMKQISNAGPTMPQAISMGIAASLHIEPQYELNESGTMNATRTQWANITKPPAMLISLRIDKSRFVTCQDLGIAPANMTAR